MLAGALGLVLSLLVWGPLNPASAVTGSGPAAEAGRRRDPPGHRRSVLYILLPLLPPLVLLAVLGLAWVEEHLLPPAGPPPHAQALPVPVRDTLATGPAERP